MLIARRQFLSLPAVAGATLAQRPAKEVRGVWLHPESMFDADPVKGRQQVRASMERLARAGFNLILPWIVSDYLVACESALYRQAHPTAAWDVLGTLIDEAARAGMALDIWYSFTAYRNAECSDFDPRVGGDPSWAARRIDEFVPDPTTGQITPRRWNDSCPQHFEARRWQQQLLLRAIQRHPPRGLHIEEPGYDYLGNCVCDLCLETFRKLYGAPLADRIKTQEAEDFRCLGTSAFMSEMREALARQFPQMVFSANGGPNWRHDRRQGRDWGRWARSGWLAYYAAQVYVTRTEVFRDRMAASIRDLSPECPVYAGIAFKWSGGGNTVAEVLRQIEAAREIKAPGVVLFSAGAFTDELYEALRTGPFRGAA